MNEDQIREEVTNSWPDCHQAQCRQVHELLDSLAQTLGVKFDPAAFSVGKAVHIYQAIERLKNPPEIPMDRFGCHKMVAKWIEEGTYRSVCQRHDGTFSAVDESEQLFLRADTIPLLADALMNWPEGATRMPPAKYVKVYAP